MFCAYLLGSQSNEKKSDRYDELYVDKLYVNSESVTYLLDKGQYKEYTEYNLPKFWANVQEGFAHNAKGDSIAFARIESLEKRISAIE